MNSRAGRAPIRMDSRESSLLPVDERATVSLLGPALTACVAILAFVAVDMIATRLAAGSRYRMKRLEIVSADNSPIHEGRFFAGGQGFPLGDLSLMDPQLSLRLAIPII
jgi:hypothetical protein